MASDDLVSSVQKTIMAAQERVTELEEGIEFAEAQAKRYLKLAQDHIETAKIKKSQLRHERLMLAESVTTLATLLVTQPKDSLSKAIQSSPELAKDLEAELNG